MRTLVYVLLSVLTIGCSNLQLNKKAAGKVLGENTFSFRDIRVQVNPDFRFLEVTDSYDVPDMDGYRKCTVISENYIFLGVDARNMVTRGVGIQIKRISDPRMRWDYRADLLKGTNAIQKGKEVIDGEPYAAWSSRFVALPKNVFFAIEEKGYRIRNFRCGLEKGVARIIGKGSSAVLRIVYIEGTDNCAGIRNFGKHLTAEGKKKVAELSKRFRENIKITHK